MKSLKDQLLKAGLTNKQTVKNTAKKKQPKLKKKDRGGMSDSAKQAEKNMQEKMIRDKQLNQNRQSEIDNKALHAQIKQLVERSKIDREEGEIAYRFTHLKLVKTIYVTSDQQSQLSKNQIGIVVLNNEKFELVPRIVIEKISQRDETCIIDNKILPNSVDQDDPYADYKIPDDLVW